ncbi:MAG: PD-(D/E)XK nuclease family protein [Leucobacter sp.]
MIGFDTSQLAALALNPRQHARVLGAPGTGKSTVLVEAYARTRQLHGFDERDVLVLAPNRMVAGITRAALEKRVDRAIGGTPVRTFVSFAFALLAQVAAAEGTNTPRLLTGTVQDEVLQTVIESAIATRASGAAPTGRFSEEVLRSPMFRAEIREFWRVIDDCGLDLKTLPGELAEIHARRTRLVETELPADELIERWQEAVSIVTDLSLALAAGRPDELSSSALLRAAAADVSEGRVAAPRLLLVDDAQEVGEGELGLLAACAAAGSRIWAFGDPDTATSVFRGERTRITAGLVSELARRNPSLGTTESENTVTLRTVHRHGELLRGFTRELTARIGTAGTGEHRAAVSAETAGEERIDFVAATSAAEQIGIVAHRMRARRLGVDGTPAVDWNEMAVVCRSRTDVARVSRGLAGHQVPTSASAGGMVLREHQIVRDLIRLLQAALELQPMTAPEVLQLLSGPAGGIDPIAVRRLRGALLLQERREARDEEREPRSTDDVLLEAFRDPGVAPAIDSAGGRALRRLGRISAAGERVNAAGGTARETLWAIWDSTGLSARWQTAALEGRGARADEAHRSLDAVMELFFVLQRHEEQNSDQPVGELLTELLESSVAEDSLARRSARDSVTITTPQGMIGREFALVAIIGPEDGVWPNTRARGSLIGGVAFERWMRGAGAASPSYQDTIHDELRLFAQACSRATRELLVVAISDEEHHPSPFFRLGRAHQRDSLPSSRLTLRGVTATMRRRLTSDLNDTAALASLAVIAEAGAPGAHPNEWYGVLPPSTSAPLVELGGDKPVPVRPSQLETVERCPLDWVVSVLGGDRGELQASLGTLVHHAFETARDADVDELLRVIDEQWHKLDFDATWESERMRITTARMAAGLAEYLQDFESSDRELLGRETGFSIELGIAELRGTADRLELRRTETGGEITVLDLKTGATAPSKPQAELHPQLQAYQLGIIRAAFAIERDADLDGARSGGARLLFVHPDAAKDRGFIERVQQPLSAEAEEELVSRVLDAAETMAGNAFLARVEHHCSDRFQPGACRLHIIPAVSRA